MMKRCLEDLEKVVLINSYTQNKEGVDRVGEQFKKWLEELGFKTKRFERELIGDHLLFYTPKRTGQKILLLGHLDTVFPPNSFEGFRKDDEWVYGAGVCDMKGGNIVALEALRHIYKKQGSIYNIDFLLVSDEETGSDDSRFVTLELAKDYDICFVFEASGVDGDVVVGRKGIGTFSIEIEGKASHAGTSYTKGVDANLEGAYKLQELVGLTNLKEGSTVNVGKIEGGIGANTISPSCRLLLELRYANIKEKERLLNSLDSIVSKEFVSGTKSKLLGSIQRDVMEPNSNQERLIRVMEEISGQTLPLERRGGVSDANLVAFAKVTTLDGLGPYGDGDHTLLERASIKSFKERIELMSSVLIHHQKEGKIDG